MADLRTVFPILADSVTEAGEPAISRIEGEAAAAIAGLIGFSFKDSSGNVVLPQLTTAGAIPVDTEADNISCLSDSGEVASPVVDTESDVVTLSLTSSTVYRDIFFLVTATRWTLYRIYWVEDVGGTPIEHDLGWAHCGPGGYTACCNMTCTTFTAAATASELRIGGTSKDKASTLRASLAVKEVA